MLSISDRAFVEEADGLGFVHTENGVRRDVDDASQNLVGNESEWHGIQEYVQPGGKVSGIA